MGDVLNYNDFLMPCEISPATTENDDPVTQAVYEGWDKRNAELKQLRSIILPELIMCYHTMYYDTAFLLEEKKLEEERDDIRKLIHTYYLESLQLSTFVADEELQLYIVLAESNKYVNTEDGISNSNKLEDLLECFQRSSTALTRFLSSVDITTPN